MEMVTGYQFNDRWYVGLTAEHVYKGKKAWEFGPNISYTYPSSIGKWTCSGQAILNAASGAFGANASVDWAFKDKLCVGIKYIYHDVRTLVGERNIPFLTDFPSADWGMRVESYTTPQHPYGSTNKYFIQEKLNTKSHEICVTASYFY